MMRTMDNGAMRLVRKLLADLQKKLSRIQVPEGSQNKPSSKTTGVVRTQ